MASAVSESQRFIRREGDGAIELSPKGDLVELEREEDNEFCMDDYPAGTQKSNDCLTSYPTGLPHENIMQQAMCKNAASVAGVTVVDSKFLVDSAYYNKRPKGCFAFACSEDTDTGVCYFYNRCDVGSDNATSQCAPAGSTNIEGGTPVCKRPKCANGTISGTHSERVASGNQNGCPTGYSAIMDNVTCQAAANCQSLFRGGTGSCSGAEWMTGQANASQHNEFPIGCYINHDDGCAYFNFVETGFENPLRPVGTPLCNVSSTTSW